MLKKLRAAFTLIFILGFASGLGWAQTPLLTPDQLDSLLAPIALFPDPLLAQIFPAASHPKQIADAEQFVAAKEDPNQIDAQPWDPSVQALAHYPEVLKMMNDKPEWTARLGQAYTAQPSDVFASVQRLRAKAQAAGNLQTNPQQVVATGNNLITVMPADPQTIYVPQYAPEAVYVQPSVAVAAPLVTFGAGFALGGWIHNEVNWGGGGVYYHSSGWSSSYSCGWSSSYHSGWSSSYHGESSSSSSYHDSSSESSSSSYHGSSSESSSSASSSHGSSSESSSSASGYHGSSSASSSSASSSSYHRGSRSGFNHGSGSRSGYHSARSSNSNNHAGRNESRRGNERGRENHNRGEHRGGGHHGGGHHGGGHRK